MNGVLIPVIIEGIRSLKDGSVSMNIVTQELAPNKAAEIFALRGKICYSYFSATQVENNETKIVDQLDPDIKYKTPSKRLRDVLYRLWEQQPEGYKDSESFYKYKMEKIIDHYKNELT